MNEMTMIAELYPEVEVSAEAVASLRAELFGTADVALVSAAPARVVNLGSYRDGPTRRRRHHVVVAAVAAAALGFAGTWIAVARHAEPSRTSSQPVDTPAETAPPGADDPYSLPLVALDAPGWTLSWVYQDTDELGRAVVFLSDDGMEGPWVELTTSSLELGMLDLPEREFGDVTAKVSDYGEGSILYWEAPDGEVLVADGWAARPETIADVLASTRVVDGVISVEELPAGARLAAPDVVAALGAYGSYAYTRTDGRTVSVSFFGGGQRSFWRATTGEERDVVTLDGEEWWILDGAQAWDLPGSAAPGATALPWSFYRANVLRGFWSWNIDGEPFTSEEEFLAVARSLVPVDETAWEASLPTDPAPS